MNDKDFLYMKRAIQLAEMGRMTVSPNPMVGAVIVKDGKIIGEGFHQKKGEGHAEVNAIKNSVESVEGSTVYCTLEPCCHTNKTTPPCTELLIEKKVSKVIVAGLDPNPEVSGKGIEKLKAAGIEVESGVLEKEAANLNKVFFKNMKTSLPYLHLKAAITLDGRVCSNSGSSKWISSEEARNEVHRLRESYDAVMVGKNTLIADNPKLTARREDKVSKDPKKIIFGNLEDRDLKHDLLKNPETVFNLYTDRTSFKGVTIQFKSWDQALKELYKQGICSILVEGGSRLLSSLLEEELYDEVTFYVTKKVIGNGTSLFESEKNTDMESAFSLNGTWRLNASGEAILEVKK